MVLPEGTQALERDYIVNAKQGEWFTAADGQRYNAVCGPVSIIKADEALGFVPDNSANWYVLVGTLEGKHVILAGCRVQYAAAINDDDKFPASSGCYDTRS
mgnify:CR=1 FL=1